MSIQEQPGQMSPEQPKSIEEYAIGTANAILHNYQQHLDEGRHFSVYLLYPDFPEVEGEELSDSAKLHQIQGELVIKGLGIRAHDEAGMVMTKDNIGLFCRVKYAEYDRKFPVGVEYSTTSFDSEA